MSTEDTLAGVEAVVRNWIECRVEAPEAMGDILDVLMDGGRVTMTSEPVDPPANDDGGAGP